MFRPSRSFRTGSESYFQDSLPFRNALLGIHKRLKFDALAASPSPNVIIGKNGRLVYTEFPVGEDQDALRPFSADELSKCRTLSAAAMNDSRRPRHPLPRRHRSCHAIYLSRFATRRVAFANSKRILMSISSQEYLRAHATVRLLDLRPALREARVPEEVYYRTDTHWNAAGGHAGYREIMFALRQWLLPHLEPLTRDELQRVFENGSGDLTRMIGATDVDAESYYDRFVPKFPRARIYKDRAASPFANVGDLKNAALSFSECDELHPARLVALVDSLFGGQLESLLAHHFRRADFVWNHRMPRDEVIAARPAVVIQEIVERTLLKPPLSDGTWR